jgi:hypothetical protein
LLQSNKSQERRDWHIADKLDVRFRGSFGKKLTSVSVADSLFAPDWRFAASRHPLPKCGAVFCCCAQEMPMNIGFLRDWARIFAE